MKAIGSYIVGTLNVAVCLLFDRVRSGSWAETGSDGLRAEAPPRRGAVPRRWFVRGIEEQPGRGLVGDEDIGDTCPQCSEQSARLVGALARGHDHPVDAAQLRQCEADDTVVERGGDQLSRGVEVIAQDIANRVGSTETLHLRKRAAPAPHHGAAVVRAPDADHRDSGLGGYAEGVGDRVLAEQPVAHGSALHEGWCEQALASSPRPFCQRPADVVGVGGGVDARRSAHRTDEGAIETMRRPKDRGQLARVATHAHGNDTAGCHVPLKILGGGPCNGPALGLRIGVARGDDGVIELKVAAHLKLQRRRFGRRADDADVDHPALSGPIEQPLDLGSRESELTPDLELRAACNEVAMGHADQKLLVGIGSAIGECQGPT